MTDPAGTDLTREDPAVLREYYQQMALIRAFELRAAEMYTRARIGGYCHLNLGEEATIGRPDRRARATVTTCSPPTASTGTRWPAAPPRPGDGRTVRTGDGLSRGRGGSMHLFDRERRLLRRVRASSAARSRWQPAPRSPSPTGPAPHRTRPQ